MVTADTLYVHFILINLC